MSISYQDLQNYARELLERGGDEITYRNVVGRSYYAAYHACLNVVSELPSYEDVHGGSHEVLIQRLIGSKNSNLRSIGYSLKYNKTFRSTADYRLEEHFPREHAFSVIKQTDKVFDRVQDYLRGAPSSAR